MKPKNRKHKKITEEMRRQQQLKNLQEECKKLECDIYHQKIQNMKNVGIRNLKVFGTLCTLALPIVLTSSIVVGGVFVCGGGLPFVHDEVKRCNKISMHYESDTDIYIEEEYESSSDHSKEDNLLIIKTPWSINDDMLFMRKNYSYDSFSVTRDLVDAILAEDFKQVVEMLGYGSEETETMDNKNIRLLDGKYYFYADVYGILEDETKTFMESDRKNTMVTVGTVIIALLGSMATTSVYANKIHILQRIRKIISECTTTEIDDLRVQLHGIQEKMLKLTMRK